MATTQYEEALRQVRSLSSSEQKRLLAEVTEHLETLPKKTISIMQLQGLGKDIWRET